MFAFFNHLSVLQISTHLPRRLSTLEMLDEVEELELVLDHYAITWGVKVPKSQNDHPSWDSWGLQEKIWVSETNEDGE
jgi:[phosphatase 2A protein]-leucine-carboxy methyltransferase